MVLPAPRSRGFLADRRTTWLSFIHAGWISILCILAFGMLGIVAGLNKEDGDAMVATLTRLFGEPLMTLFNLALIVSAISTLDSTLSAAAKLAISNMRLAAENVRNGRIAMIAFMLGGLGFLFLGSKDLFSAVAVSGTASLYLTPTIVISIWLSRTDVPVWSYAASFCAAMLGAALYFLESSGYTNIVGPWTGVEHKYAKLLVICVIVLILGFSAYVVGMVSNRRNVVATPNV